MPDRPRYEVIIIGAGPAGLTAGLYVSRARLHCLLVERGLFGGQIANAERIENYPGFPEGIDGLELGQLMLAQATRYGLKTVTAEATGIELQGGQRVVKTTEGDFEAGAVIIAGGSQRQKLGVFGEEEFTGKGVSYCATCDAAFFRDQSIAVVGGGDAAISEALHLVRFASKVTVIHRRRALRATRILQERVFAESKIQFLWNTAVEVIEGEQFVRKLRLKQLKTGEKSALEVAGVFVSIGVKPDTGYLRGILPLDNVGHIITNENMETTVSGILAVGDIRHNSARQVITAAGDGATAAINVERFLTESE
ncbi:MAG: thioredoxin-disulfide reductase [Dehalococcoidales bacterium]|jgi:thioredoxin reductase (NADPH)|nr:thioredoxin-disulfide reductase [Dehalococcoidales bacterium]MDP6738027.1 thioredoxin-disulfide reductase [Dehalococcoidales bacterium]